MALDLHPSVTTVAGLLRALPDEALDGPTPCPEMSVGDLIDHVQSFCVAFTAAAIKEPLELPPGGPSASAAELGDDWRERIPARLQELAAAWDDPGAWDGMTAAGGLDLPGEVAGMISLDEVVIHGWDLAVATGQPYEVDPASLAALHGFVEQFVGDGPPREGLFGPQVPVPDDAPLLDRVLGLTGRDPGWTP
jgi:uncharacterized protein (TIGR03086 family)